MLDDLPALESKHVEYHLVAREVVVALRDDVIAVGKDANGCHRRSAGQTAQEGGEPSASIDNPQVMLDELLGADDFLGSPVLRFHTP
jgi:hypothetical protein